MRAYFGNRSERDDTEREGGREDTNPNHLYNVRMCTVLMADTLVSTTVSWVSNRLYDAILRLMALVRKAAYSKGHPKSNIIHR